MWGCPLEVTVSALVGPANDPQFINRLVFAGAISSLEAYLGDTLINAVQERADIRDALLRNHKELGAISATAAELAEDPDIITKRLIAEGCVPCGSLIAFVKD